MTETNPAEWWERLTADQRDTLTRLLATYSAFVPNYQPGTVPTLDELATVLAWQRLEIDVLDGYTAWLTRTKALFARRGWPWTSGELMARAHIREVGE